MASTRSWRATTAEHLEQLRQRLAARVDHRHRRVGRTPAARSSSSKRTHTGTLPSGSACSTSPISFSELTVGSQTMRAPCAGRDLDGGGVEAADRVVERDRPQRPHARAPRRSTTARALGGRGVVRLQPEAGQAELEAALRELEVGDAARREVGRDVHVRVEPAADELARAVGGDGGGHRTSIINAIVDNP